MKVSIRCYPATQTLKNSYQEVSPFGNFPEFMGFRYGATKQLLLVTHAGFNMP